MHAQSLEEQFPCEEGYKISRCNEFKFKESVSTEPQSTSITLTVPSQHNQCIIALEPANGKVGRWFTLLTYLGRLECNVIYR